MASKNGNGNSPAEHALLDDGGFESLEQLYSALNPREKWLLCNRLLKQAIPDILTTEGQARLSALTGAYPPGFEPRLRISSPEEELRQQEHYAALVAFKDAQDAYFEVKQRLWSAKRRGRENPVTGIYEKTPEMWQDIHQLEDEVVEAEAAYRAAGEAEVAARMHQPRTRRPSGGKFPGLGLLMGR